MPKGIGLLAVIGTACVVHLTLKVMLTVTLTFVTLEKTIQPNVNPEFKRIITRTPRFSFSEQQLSGSMQVNRSDITQQSLNTLSFPQKEKQLSMPQIKVPVKGFEFD